MNFAGLSEIQTKKNSKQQESYGKMQQKVERTRLP